MKCKIKKILKKILIVIVSLPLLLNFSCKEKTDIKEQRISDCMNYCYENDLFNGSVLVAIKSKVIYKNAFGYANLETNKSLKLETPLNIGSVSKQFTSMGIMILKEQGLISYDDRLSDYFPKIKFSDRITIRQLLSHTSGFPRLNSSLEGISTMEKAYSYIVSLDSLLFNPGERYSYSNSGYILLALIIEKITGISYDEFMKQNIFIPLKMNNTCLRTPLNSLDEIRAIGFNRFGERYDDFGYIYGQGGIYSTVEDLFKWDQALYSEKLVSQKSLKEAFTPGLLNNGNSSRTISDSTWGYGFGWLLRKTNAEDIVWHDGGFNGFSAVIYRELNNRDCIILISNMGQMGANAPVYPIHNILLNILDGKPYELPRIPIAIKVRKTIENNGIGSAIKEYYQLKKNKPDKYDFSENQLNSLGYYYLNNGKRNEAITLFRINVEQFPASSNAYDSFGEAYMKNGLKELAIKNYEKSLELNPMNSNAQEMLKKLKTLK